MNNMIRVLCCLVLVACAGCRHAGTKSAPVARAQADEPALGAEEVLFNAQILVFPKGVLGKFPLALRKELETGRPVPQQLVEAFQMNANARPLGTPSWRTKFGEIGSYGMQTYRPRNERTAGSHNFNMVTIDCAPIAKMGKGMTLYAFMSFISDDAGSNIHGVNKRAVTPEPGMYQYYRLGNSSEDVLVFIEVLTKDAMRK